MRSGYLSVLAPESYQHVKAVSSPICAATCPARIEPTAVDDDSRRDGASQAKSQRQLHRDLASLLTPCLSLRSSVAVELLACRWLPSTMRVAAAAWLPSP